MSDSQYNYPKHHVAVDCVIFGYENEELKLLIAQRKFEPEKGQWSLIGGWVQDDETIENAAKRVLMQITGLKDIYLEQVCVFSDPKRDSGGRVISVVFYAMIRIDKYNEDMVKNHGAEWRSFKQLPNLIFDHNEMIEKAHEKLKLKASYELIGKNLLTSKFTIFQLRSLYEAIFQREFDPGNFRKKTLSLKALERTDDKDMGQSKKGAYYYRFRENKEEIIKERVVKQ